MLVRARTCERAFSGETFRKLSQLCLRRFFSRFPPTKLNRLKVRCSRSAEKRQGGFYQIASTPLRTRAIDCFSSLGRPPSSASRLDQSKAWRVTRARNLLVASRLKEFSFYVKITAYINKHNLHYEIQSEI